MICYEAAFKQLRLLSNAYLKFEAHINVFLHFRLSDDTVFRKTARDCTKT